MDLVRKCDILTEVWSKFDEDEEWEAFIEYLDLSLPFAFGVAKGLIVELSPEGQSMIQAAWEYLCGQLDLPEEGEWESLEEMLKASDDLYS